MTGARAWSLTLLVLAACATTAPTDPEGSGSPADTAVSDSGGPTNSGDSGVPAETGTPDSADPGTEACAACFEVDPAFVMVDPGDCDGDGLSNGFEEITDYVQPDGSTARTSPCMVDSDRDTLSDREESAFACELPTMGDSDLDGLGDAAERVALTSSCEMDSDGDGIDDGSDPEPTSDAGAADVDGDGLTLREERANGTSDTASDTDGDSLSDPAELAETLTSPTRYDSDNDCFDDGAELVIAALYDLEGYTAAGYPSLDAVGSQDSDGDGLLDGEEANPNVATDPLLASTCAGSVYLGTVAVKADTDDDMLSDWAEVRGTSGYTSDPTKTDTDGDGLDDHGEVLFGTNPQNGDTDGDCLSDDDELKRNSSMPTTAGAVALRPTDEDSDGDGLWDGAEVDATCPGFLALSSPHLTDSDDDGLSDKEEVYGWSAAGCAVAPATTGTCTADPLVGDTDGDGVEDGDEATVHSSNPRAADTDGDGYADGDEVSWGVASGATVTSYVLDGTQPDGLVGVNDEVECSSVSNVPGATTFQEPFGTTAIADDLAAVYYTSYGGDYLTFGGGSECTCTFTIDDVRPSEVSGVSVRLETAAHTAGDDSYWDFSQTPSAVAIYQPWAQDTSTGATGRAFAFGAHNTQNTDASGVEYWNSFGYNPISPDTVDYGTTDSSGATTFLNRIGGVSTGSTANFVVTVSRRSTTPISTTSPVPEDIGHCEHLMGGYGSSYNLKMSVDWYDAHALTSATCSTGSTSETRFHLFPAEGSDWMRPIPTDGSPHYAGATPRRISIADWKGAAGVEARDEAGHVIRLKPGRSSIDTGNFRLAGSQWRVFDAAGRPVSVDLAIDIRHSCTTPPPAEGGATSALFTWAHVRDWLKRSAGLSLDDLFPRSLPDEAGVFRLEIVSDPDTDKAELVMEAVGAGIIERLPLETLAKKRWRVQISRPGLRLEAQILAAPRGGYEIRLIGGAIGQLPLRPFQAMVGGVPVREQ